MDDALTTRLTALEDSHDPDAFNELGCDLSDAGLREEAAACFRRAADLGSATGRFNLGNVLRDLGHLEAAVVAFEAAAAAGESDAWLNLGDVRRDLGHLPAAAAAFEAAVAAGDPAAWLALGHTRCAMGDVDGGTLAYRAGAVAGDSDAALSLAFELREPGDRDGAEAAAQEAADAGNRYAQAVVACWRWCSTRDPALEADLRLGAEHFSAARADLADLLLATGRPDEGRAVLERGAKLGEHDSLLPLGNLYAKLGLFSAAEDAYRADIAAGDRYGHNNPGKLFLDQGDIDGAIAQFRLGADARDALAARQLRELLEEESDE